MSETGNSKVISVVAYFLGSSEEQAAQFHKEVCSQLRPRPSLLTFTRWLPEMHKADVTASEFVDFVAAHDRSLNKIIPGVGKPHMQEMVVASEHHPDSERPSASCEIESAIRHLIRHLAILLPEKKAVRKQAARVFLTDMFRIYPRAAREQDLFLRALKKCVQENRVTVDNVWDTMLHLRNPQLDYVKVVSIPMGGKT